MGFLAPAKRGAMPMGHIETKTNVAWKNYHENQSFTIAEQATFRRDAAPAASGPEAFARTAPVMQQHVAAATARKVRAGVLGATWSWSGLIGNPALQLATCELDALHAVPQGDLHAGSLLDAGYLAYVGGGCGLSQLVKWAEQRGRSISICGSYLGQTVAGAMATGVNGSTLGQGGFQNQIRGIHLVTGPGHSVWIEDPGAPALSDATALAFADEVIRDTELFAASLVHLGAMGIVNGVLFELVDKDLFYVVRLKRTVDPQWLGLVEAAQYTQIAQGMGLAEDPVYYEVQIDPYDPWGTPALHSFYYRHEGGAAVAAAALAPGGVAALRQVHDLLPAPTEVATFAGPASPPILPDLYAVYAAEFAEVLPPGQNPQAELRSWGDLHKGCPNPRTHSIIYDAALAIDQNRIVEAVTAMTSYLQQRLHELPPQQQLRHMIYTLRFVDKSAGLMGYTRFDRSVVIDLHGLKISPLTLRAAGDSIAALAAKGIAFCQHWGKFTPDTSDWVTREFGPGNPLAPLARWQAARARLLGPATEPVFRNEALVNWGLVSP